MKPILRLLILLIVNLLIFAGCRCKNCCEVPPPVKQKEAPFSGINVKIPKGKSFADFAREVYLKFDIRIDEKQHVKSCPCDTSLVSVNFPGLIVTGNGQLPARADVPGQSDSLDLPGFVFSKNYNLYESEKDLSNSSPTGGRNDRFTILSSFNNPSTASKTVTVAIFDSGIDSGLLGLNYLGVEHDLGSCFSIDAITELTNNGTLTNGTIKGLNFAPADYATNEYKMSNISDTHPGRHGTNVASLIVKQFADSKSPISLKLLIMRVLNDQNKGDLFGIMCAMYQAKKMGADIYNMSLGYYGKEDPIFKEYVDSIRSTGSKPGWLVASAGNSIPGYDNPDFKTDDPENRNLSQRVATSKLYPAYFSSYMDHVISVTTVRSDSFLICSRQNFDPKSVDIGVQAANCYFKTSNLDTALRGTSFAAPVVTGWIAGKDGLAVLKKLNLLSPAEKDELLESFIISGKYIKYFVPENLSKIKSRAVLQ